MADLNNKFELIISILTRKNFILFAEMEGEQAIVRLYKRGDQLISLYVPDGADPHVMIGSEDPQASVALVRNL